MLRRRAAWRAGPALAAAASLAGCSAMIPISINGDLQRPTASFGADPTHPQKACLGGLAVHELSNAMMRPVWSIEARGRECRSLRQIFYGETPDGFETTVEALPLKPGVDGVSGGPLSRVPWRGGGDFVFEGGQWRSAEGPGLGVGQGA